MRVVCHAHQARSPLYLPFLSARYLKVSFRLYVFLVVKQCFDSSTGIAVDKCRRGRQIILQVFGAEVLGFSSAPVPGRPSSHRECCTVAAKVSG